MGQDNTIYTFSVELSFSCKGQNKSKLRKQISNILIYTYRTPLYQVAVTV